MRVLMICLVLMAASAEAGSRSIGADLDRLEASQAIRFRNADGGTFDPDRVVIVAPSGTIAADFPNAPRDLRNEDRIDLSDTPVLGQLFQRGRATTDVREDGRRVGTVYRMDRTLIVDAREAGEDLTGLPLILTTVLPRYGAVSFDLGRLRYGPGTAGERGRPIGAAFVVNGELVLASNGGEPAWPSVEAFFKSLY